MKIALIAIGVLLCAWRVEALEITSELAKNIRSYDLIDLKEKGPKLAGQIVRVKFNRRVPGSATRMRDGSMVGHLHWSTGSGTNMKFDSLFVFVPPEASLWFETLETKESRTPMFVYVRIAEEPKKPSLLLGREIKTDLKGSRIEW